MADLQTGDRCPTRARLEALIDELADSAAELGCGTELADAGRLVRANGAARQRSVAAERGLVALCGWLADQFAPEPVSPGKRPG